MQKIKSSIEQFLQYRQPYHATAEISFYGGNFLGLDPETIQKLLHLAQDFIIQKRAQSIRFSTRPDTITAVKLSQLKPFSIRTIEVGIQSLDDQVLRHAMRGHSADNALNALRLLKENDYTIGAQIMIGLPYQDAASALDTAHQVAALLPDFVRIYPTVVLRGSQLETWFRSGKYEPLTLQAAVDQAKNIYAVFQRSQIPVIRMGLQASEDLHLEKSLVAGPYHPAFGHLVHSERFFENVVTVLDNKSQPLSAITIFVHTNSIPKMRGLKNSNIERLQEKFEIQSVQVLGDDSLAEDAVRVSVK
jgi:histone acetyltransferase (RNA polymerase elongator complex component)